MKKKMSIFQIIIMLLFFVMAVAGFIVFSQLENVGSENSVDVGNVIIWGTLDKNLMEKILNNIVKEKPEFFNVYYVQKDKQTFNTDLTESLALDTPPDLIILSNESLYKNLNKIQIIPYSSFGKRAYLDTFVDASYIFLQKNGFSGIPFIIDPMIMYYNKSIFKSEGITSPPKYWSEFINFSKKITKKDEDNNILRSAIAFGDTNNVSNFKEILLLLFFQLGNKVLVENNNTYKTMSWSEDSFDPSSALEFFTDFSNPTNSFYSWNRSLPNSIDFFNSGKLATYFGFASEANIIRSRNPNLYFDVAEIPSIGNAEDKLLINKTTYAKISVLSIPNNSNVNFTGAFNVALELSSRKTQKFISNELFLPPVRNDILSEVPEDIYMDIFYKESIYSYSFLDPEYKKTNSIFEYMVNSVKIGRQSFFSAIKTAFREIDSLLLK